MKITIGVLIGVFVAIAAPASAQVNVEEAEVEQGEENSVFTEFSYDYQVVNSGTETARFVVRVRFCNADGATVDSDSKYIRIPAGDTAFVSDSYRVSASVAEEVTRIVIGIGAGCGP